MSAEPILRTAALRREFGGVAAVAGVDFRLDPGELRCLIGPNGAGKSTFFKMLSGQLRPSSGRIWFRGDDITREERCRIARRGLAVKTQVPSVFNAFTVAENILVAARRTMPAKRAATVLAQVLDEVGLAAVAGRTVGELAHGQRQWVEIGMLLAADPSLILLDEPTAGMTSEEVQRTAALVRAMNERRAVVVVAHDMQFVRLVSAGVTVFNQGRILVEGGVEEVLADQRVRDVYLGKRIHAAA